jgi:hypothetical protein
MIAAPLMDDADTLRSKRTESRRLFAPKIEQGDIKAPFKIQFDRIRKT